MPETAISAPPVNWDALPLMLTVQEMAAAVLRVDAHTAYELVRTHRVPHVHLGRLIRIPRDQLREHLERPHAVQEPGYVPPTLHRNGRPGIRTAAFNRGAG
ncbi:MAG: helix-turn-helix domain-containing protein [bacterium]|nr:helix-turn-helix domain-containing protein [bacterium]